MLCAALVAVALPGALAAGDAANANGTGPQIRRTEYGIAHVLAHNYSDLGYGYGYAFAQDNACQMADRVLTLRGERSRYLGPTTKTNDSLGGPIPNLDSDTYFQAQRRDGTVRRLLARPAPLGPSPELRQLVDGYAAGFDRYLREVGVAHLPDPQCQGQPWVQPITAEDVWANVLDIDQATTRTHSCSGRRHDLIVHMQDGDNHFRRVRDGDGAPVSYASDSAARRLPNGDPDYSDPHLFPTIWRAR